MRSRTWREGSVGLFIIVGIALFGTLGAWLQGLRINRNSYTVTITFDNSNGMVVGGSVRYRGVKVGTITKIIPTSNGIDAKISISPATLKIPRKLLIEANQAGLISETAIDLNPEVPLENQEQLASPLSRKCDRTIILCDGDALEGQTGISINNAMRSTITLSERFTDEEFFGNIVELTANASIAAQEAGQLSKELTLLSKAVRGEVKSVSTTANSITAITATSARQINSTAEAYRQTALELNQLTQNLNGLILENQANIGGTLDSIRSTSAQLSSLVATFNQTLDAQKVGQLLTNLETLSANATVASENLKTASDALGDPTTILTLQQTLQAARATFENVQKITADLDELTGNPSFRRNVQDLIEGLNDLVSSTETLEQQIYLAQQLPTLHTEQTEVVAESEVVEESVEPTEPAYEDVQRLFTDDVESEGNDSD
ncbi:MAG: MCE family protein [Spirulina sp. SIO3F2]|nr:MCE family protein [Spirulina sp. SIO3F2]